MMPGGRQVYKLNDYQQLMLKISELTPYNAVHAVKLKSNITDVSVLQMKLEQSINHVIRKLGLGEPIFSVKRKKVQYKPVSRSVLLSIKDSALQVHANTEMNRTFLDSEFPMRFFIIASGNTYYLSITYNHWIADAYGISRFIEAVFSHYRNDFSHKLNLLTPDMKSCFPSIYGLKAPLYRIFALIRSALRFSSAYRNPLNDNQQTESGSTSYIFEPEVIIQLRQYCKNKNITLNDLFVSILAKLFGDLTRSERLKSQKKYFKFKRDRIIVAIITNIRQQSLISLDYIFSMFLGFFYLSFKNPEEMSFQTLSQSIHLQTQQLKNRRGALKQSLLFKIQNWFWDKKKNIRGKYRLFNKNTPITVGISNMDMRHVNNNLIKDIEQYIRFSPTAMVCPIVFNLTTFNEHLSLGINFRKVCYSFEKVDEIQSRFVMAIYEIAAEQKANQLYVFNRKKISDAVSV